MSLEEDILIQDFLKDKLSEKERNEVLFRIENDEIFRDKVNFEQQLFLNLNEKEWSVSKNTGHDEVEVYEQLLRDKSSQELKETLQEVNADYQAKQKKNNRSWWSYAGIAAVALIIGVTVFLSSNTSSQELYANYINLSELPSLVERGKTDHKIFIKAQKAFETKQYDKVLGILANDLDTIQNNKATIYLYIGISQMELGKFNEAEKTFTRLTKSNLIDAPKGKWYMALLFLKQNNTAKAKEILREIMASKNNYKHDQAKELLELL
ncbi:tol-pal system YbgF family protein [Aquimarina sp. AU474]|uniref:tetratricopeptide repeat protein n=1 Tax=Aquimarina sp. AU474 TaxID=2108529 RepID=UPI000D68E537|nr:tetratricopeptide repeat protein [Aquimarina sp. AU474]